MRTTILGNPLETLPKEVEIIISTKVPGKYLIVDTETGDVWQYVHDDYLCKFRRATHDQLAELVRIISLLELESEGGKA